MDIRTGREVIHYDYSAEGSGGLDGPAVGAGSIWTGVGRKILRVDPGSGAVQERIAGEGRRRTRSIIRTFRHPAWNFGGVDRDVVRRRVRSMSRARNDWSRSIRPTMRSCTPPACPDAGQVRHGRRRIRMGDERGRKLGLPDESPWVQDRRVHDGRRPRVDRVRRRSAVDRELRFGIGRLDRCGERARPARSPWDTRCRGSRRAPGLVAFTVGTRRRGDRPDRRSPRGRLAV